jgi:hypothetical protein
MAKSASIEVTGTNGAKITSRGHDAAEAQRTAATMRKQSDIKSVKVIPQK